MSILQDITKGFNNVEHFIASKALDVWHGAKAVEAFVLKVGPEIQAQEPKLKEFAAQFGANAADVERIAANVLGRAVNAAKTAAVAGADGASVIASQGLNISADIALFRDLVDLYDKFVGSSPAPAAPAPADPAAK